MLLERGDAAASIADAFAAVTSTGFGRFVLVGGEAGIGKTSLVRDVAEGLGEVLWGSCDSLSTPRVFGPLLDVAADVGGPLAEALGSSAPREAVLAATADLLRSRAPVALVVEDVHWADEATVDLLTYLRRRIDRTGALVVVTYRDDEVGPDHPLAPLLGHTGSGRDVRVRLEPLSSEAVARLAGGRAVDAAAVHRVTGGNPFFVTELLAVDGGDELPGTVRDAVHARLASLSPAARGVAGAIAVVPAQVELWLVDALADDPAQAAAVDECIERGVLTVADAGGAVRFRHELARLAVRDALGPARRRELHRRALDALRHPPTGRVDIARVAHHAFEAGDPDALLEAAPAAADEAARLGAHRQAVEHLEHALRFIARLPRARQLDLWSRLGVERMLVGAIDGSVDAFTAAIDLARATGDDLRLGEMLCRLSSVHTTAGREREAARAMEESLAVLEPHGPSEALAVAVLQRCSRHMLARQMPEAEAWGRRAAQLASDVGRDDLLAQSLVQSGVAVLMAGHDEGHRRILRGIALAERTGAANVAVLGYSQIGSGGGEVRRYELAVPALERGLAIAREHDLVATELYVAAWLARCHLEQGRWSAADGLLVELFRHPRFTGIARMVGLVVLGRLRARRGDPEVTAPLDEARTLARQSEHLQRLWPAAVVRAEAAWLRGSAEALAAEVPGLQEAHRLAVDCAYPWAMAELECWIRRAGAVPEAAGGAADEAVGAAAGTPGGPFRLALAGRPEEAAAAWDGLGCGFEAAVALLESGDAELVRSALERFTAIGSPPAVRLAADELRRLGAPVPRGPNARTRGNVAGLTGREVDVLELLAEGLRNAEIAARLVISPKTVDHHVSSVLAKLGAPTRQAAAAKALQLGLLGGR